MPLTHKMVHLNVDRLQMLVLLGGSNSSDFLAVVFGSNRPGGVHTGDDIISGISNTTDWPTTGTYACSVLTARYLRCRTENLSGRVPVQSTRPLTPKVAGKPKPMSHVSPAIREVVLGFRGRSQLLKVVRYDRYSQMYDLVSPWQRRLWR